MLHFKFSLLISFVKITKIFILYIELLHTTLKILKMPIEKYKKLNKKV